MRVMQKNILILLIAFVSILHADISLEAQDMASGTLYTADGETIAYEHYKQGFNSVVIICPGFYNSKINRWMQKTVELVLTKYDVIIFDFRGHGQSSGDFTWSAKEHMDVDAVADYAKAAGYKHVGIVAFSLGAASSVNAASKRNDIDSMVLISCPSSFRMVDFHFWEPEMFSDLQDNIESKWQGKGARTTHIFMHKEKPIENIKLIKDTPMLFIHGDKDWVIKDKHSRRLYDTTNTKKKLEIIEGGLHSERLVQFHFEKMQKLILDWFSETLK